MTTPRHAALPTVPTTLTSAFLMAIPLCMSFSPAASATSFSHHELETARNWCTEANNRLKTYNENMRTNYAIEECAASGNAQLVEGYRVLSADLNFNDGAIRIAIIRDFFKNAQQIGSVAGGF